MEKTLEQNLMREVSKRISELKQRNADYISKTVLDRDEYCQRVGMIQGLEASLEVFEEIHNAFFPST